MNENLTEETPLTPRERKLTDLVEKLNGEIRELHEANAALHDGLDEKDDEIVRLNEDLDTANKTIRELHDTSLKTQMMDVLCKMVIDGVECPDIGAAAVAYYDLLRVRKEER